MFDEIKRLSIEKRLEVYERLIKVGIVTADEVREAEYLPPKEDADCETFYCEGINITIDIDDEEQVRIEQAIEDSKKEMKEKKWRLLRR